jgi:uncharacterized membrane protein
VPEVPDDPAALREALLGLWPRFFSFFISFWFVGTYWVAHHRVFHYIRGYDRRLLFINLLFLMWIVLLPFSSLLGGLAFLIGLILFGIATMRAGAFPRWAGVLLIVGDVVFGAASFSGSASLVVEVIGALITCAAFVWLGLALLSGGSASARQLARVS